MIPILSVKKLQEQEADLCNRNNWEILHLVNLAASSLTQFLFKLISAPRDFGIKNREPAHQDFSHLNLLILAGRGLNGADALKTACLCIESGIQSIHIAYLNPRESSLNGVLLEELKTLRVLKSSSVHLYPEPTLLPLDSCDLILDGLLGTGCQDSPHALVKDWIKQSNQSNKQVLSIDMPSGLPGDLIPDDWQKKGTVAAQIWQQPPLIQASWTLSFWSPKITSLLYPGRSCAGRQFFTCLISDKPSLLPTQIASRQKQPFLTKANLSSLNHSSPSHVQLPLLEEIFPLLTSPFPDTHKYQRGKILILAGSLGMQGAALLSARAAQRGGAGLVRLLYPAGLFPAFGSLTHEILTQPLGSEKDFYFNPDHLSQVLPWLSWADVVLVGPGLSKNTTALKFLEVLAPYLGPKTVLDGEGLYIYKCLSSDSDKPSTKNFSEIPPNLKQTSDTSESQEPKIILTPHTGEYEYWLGGKLRSLPRPWDWIDEASQLCPDVGLLLKGPLSLYSYQKHTQLLPYGHPALGTAGAGDILAGLLASLWFRYPAQEAVSLAVAWHGLAGQLASKQNGPVSVVASDILNALPLASKESQIFSQNWPANKNYPALHARELHFNT